jgi:Fe-S cluster assembly protein SufB
MSVSVKQSFIDSPDEVFYDVFLRWLTEETVKKISFDLKEPDWMLQLRLNSLKVFYEIKTPCFWPDVSSLDFDNLVYYAKPKKWFIWSTDSWDKVPQNIKNIFQRLNIPEAEQQFLAWVWWQFDSSVVYHKLKERWQKLWIIFDDISEAIREYPDLVKKYFMKLVPSADHQFAALHGAVWSGGTFVYIPKWIKISDPLQAYFRMNTYEWWQFEHTLIVLEDDASCSYIEWCSAPKYDKRSIHAWCVEIFVGKNSNMRYTSVENRSLNTFNLNTKRAVIDENSHMEWIWWNLWSWATMLYPCSILKWNNSTSDSLSLVVASENQNQDVWTKVIHIWKNTSSNIISKSISKSGWINTYRWLVKILPTAVWAVVSTRCDALLLDDISVSDTVPVIKVDCTDATVSHEATAWKIDEDQLFYLMSRWLSEEKSMAMIVNGFVSSITKQLPLEYAWELNHLIELEMDKSVW